APARARVGRERRPVQQHGRSHDRPVAAQARRSAADRDRRRRRLSAVRQHVSARSRLTLLYTSLFAVGGAAVVSITYLLVAHTLDSTTPRTTPPSIQPALERCLRAASRHGGISADVMRKCADVYASGVH